MHQAEEDMLVIAAQSGSVAAFELLFKKYQQALVRFAYKISSSEQIAQDAVQEVWIKISRTLRKLDDPRMFRSWLYRLVRWRTIDLMRKVQRNESLKAEYSQQQSDVKVETDDSQDDELNAAIQRLPALEKQMIGLFYLDDLSVNEIAIILDIPPGTVKSRLSRARKLLKERFNH